MDEAELKKITEFCQLNSEERELFGLYMRKAKINKLMIRQVLCEQGRTSHEAFYLLQGTVNLTVCLSNGQKLILCQLGEGEFLNLELVLNDWKSKYTITVSSSFIRYVSFEQREILLLTTHIRQQIQTNFHFREKEVAMKNKRIAEEEKRRKMRDTIDKLSLPSINLQSVKKKERINPISQQFVRSHIDVNSDVPNPNISGSRMSKQFSQQIYRLKQLRNESIQLKEKHPSEQPVPHFEHKDKLVEFKLQRLKSERSILMHNSKQTDSNRSERLFKSQLKHIVKRKLLFERKHFQILKKIANKDNKAPPKKIAKGKEQAGPLDNYFNL